MHAFPSNQDMNNFVQKVEIAEQKSILYLFAFPFAFLLRVANFLSIFWFDAAYALFLSFLLPAILFVLI